MIIEDIIPSTLLDSPDYEKLCQVLFIINNDIRSIIEVFPEIVQLDNAPEVFLPKLSELINYQCNASIPISEQRDILSRIINVYRDRGTPDSIIMAATYGDDPFWVGSRILAKGSSADRYLATISYPKDKLFTHSVSAHSRTDHYPDNSKWRDGTLLVHVGKLNDQITNAVAKVVPAGLKVFFEVMSDYSNESEVIVFGEWLYLINYEIDYEMIIRDAIYNAACYDVPSKGNRNRSGSQELYYDYNLYYEMTVSMASYEDKVKLTPSQILDSRLNHDRQYSGFESHIDYYGVPKRSTRSGTRSGKYAYDGLWNGEIGFICPTDAIEPNDSYYPVRIILSKKVKDYTDYVGSVDVEVEKIRR